MQYLNTIVGAIFVAAAAGLLLYLHFTDPIHKLRSAIRKDGVFAGVLRDYADARAEYMAVKRPIHKIKEEIDKLYDKNAYLPKEQRAAVDAHIDYLKDMLWETEKTAQKTYAELEIDLKVKMIKEMCSARKLNYKDVMEYASNCMTSGEEMT